jgi:sugar phosphate isomerase/epimerase
MKISCFTVMQSQLELEEVVPNLARNGYQGVELRGLAPHLPPETSEERAGEIKALCEQYNVPVIGIASYTGEYVGKDYEFCQKQLADLEKHCKLANLLGCDMVRNSPGGPPVYNAKPEDWQEAVAWMQKACDLAAGYGIRLVMEIHNGELIESAEDAMRIIELTGRDNLGVIHDAGNMYVSGVNFGEESVKTLGDRLFHVHVKDELRVSDESLPHSFRCDTRNGNLLFQATLLDEGGADHRPLLRGLKAAGYQGYLSLEAHFAGDDVTVPGEEISRLRKMMKEVGVV